MKYAVHGIFLVLLSAIIGTSWALFQLNNINTNTSFMIYNGPWRVNPVMDLSNHFQRALIAKVGLFALRETEVIYFTATMDNEGNPLDSEHDYIIEGTVPDARYWSYTVYGDDNFLVPNPGKIYGYNQETIHFTPQESDNPELSEHTQPIYTMILSRDESDHNWLPSGQNKQLAITLRLYNAAPAVYKNLATIPLPDIKKVP